MWEAKMVRLCAEYGRWKGQNTFCLYTFVYCCCFFPDDKYTLYAFIHFSVQYITLYWNWEQKISLALMTFLVPFPHTDSLLWPKASTWRTLNEWMRNLLIALTLTLAIIWAARGAKGLARRTESFVCCCKLQRSSPAVAFFTLVKWLVN